MFEATGNNGNNDDMNRVASFPSLVLTLWMGVYPVVRWLCSIPHNTVWVNTLIFTHLQRNSKYCCCFAKSCSSPGVSLLHPPTYRYLVYAVCACMYNVVTTCSLSIVGVHNNSDLIIFFGLLKIFHIFLSFRCICFRIPADLGSN